MVLPGADRESADNASRTDFGDDIRQSQEAGSSAYGASDPSQDGDMTPEQRHLNGLTTVDLKHVDFQSLYAKQRSLVAYVNPAYEKWFKLKVGLSIVQAQIRVQRVLTPPEMAHYADAVVDANNAGTLYKRVVLWPATAIIIASSRGRVFPSAPTMIGRVMSNVFSIRRPTSQFILAWLIAGAVEGSVAASGLEQRLRTDPKLQGLYEDIRTASTARGNRLDMRKQDLEQQQQAVNDLSNQILDTGDPSGDDTGATANTSAMRTATQRWSSSNQSGPAEYPSSSASFDGDASPTEEPYPYDDASPTAKTQPTTTQPVTGAWDRLRQRTDTERRGNQQDRSMGSWEQRRNTGFGSNTDYTTNPSDHASRETDAGERSFNDGGDSWDRRRNVGADVYTETRGSTGSVGRTSGTLGDSFSFSESDEERELAKIEAQEEFDRRIERERQGRDFEPSSSASGRSKW